MHHFSSSFSTVNERLNDFFAADLPHFLPPLLRTFFHLDSAPYHLQRASITHTLEGIMTDILFFIIARSEFCERYSLFAINVCCCPLSPSDTHLHDKYVCTPF